MHFGYYSFRLHSLTSLLLKLYSLGKKFYGNINESFVIFPIFITTLVPDRKKMKEKEK